MDTNVLLLYLIGSADIQYIEKHKRVSAYNAQDFMILLDFMTCFSKVIYPPQVIAEVGNLLDRQNGEMDEIIFEKFKSFVEEEKEIYIESTYGFKKNGYKYIGVTDSILLELASSYGSGDEVHLITADLELAVAAETEGYSVTNFNHIIS